MNAVKKTTLSFIIILLSSIFTVLMVEVGLQIYHKDNPWKILRQANILRDFQFTYNIGDLYNSDAKTVYLKTNQFGLRDDCNSTKDIKIITVGGSTTIQRFVAFEATYQKIMQDRIRAEIGAFGCISNAGVSGHSTFGHIFALEKWFPLIPDLKPDYVLLYVGVNDAPFMTIGPKRAENINDNIDVFSMKRWLMQFEIIQGLLPIYRFYKSKYNNLAYAGDGSEQYVEENYIVKNLGKETPHLSQKNATLFRQRLQKIINLVGNMGAKPICISQPHLFTKNINGKLRGLPILGTGEISFSGLDYDYSIRQLNAVMAELCGDLYLDLYNQKFSTKHFYDGVHTTDKGSIYVGNLMADFFINKNLHIGLSKNQ